MSGPADRPGATGAAIGGSRLTPGLMALLVASGFATAGTIHYQTPMLGDIAAEFGVDAAAAGWVATLSFTGYFAGTVLLVPLGDIVDKRTMVLLKMGGLVAALLAMAAAPSLWALAAAAFVVGTCCGVSQHTVPLVSEWSPPDRRGAGVGTLLTGLFLGILWARLAGGVVAATLGWRAMFVIAAAMVAVMATAMAWRLPAAPPRVHMRYRALLGSMWRLYRDQPLLRHASIVQMLIGLGYGAFWATVAAMLVQLHGLGPLAAGLMAIPGAAGVLISRRAGRWMDRRGPAPVVRAGAAGVIAAYGAFAFAPAGVGAAVVGAILLDCGLRAAVVANQTLAAELVPEARSRSSTVLMAHMWGGNAAGAFLGSVMFAAGGWIAVCAVGLCGASLALLFSWRGPGGAAARG
ncbi:MAG: MFS transporter [Burkholderiales bacterium]|nr:MFS transporter [Burkholderiales bacterium]